MSKKIKFSVLLVIVSLRILSYSNECYAGLKCDIQVTAKSAIAIEWITGKILFEKNKDLKLPMASTTKIMTAILAIENCDLNKEIEIPAQAIGVPGSSIYLEKGERLKIIELLYGLMLASGNDAAAALAISVCGDVKKFVNLMNKKAKELGLENTMFSSPHGLEEGEHYTTAHDLARLTAYAMKNQTFREIVSTTQKEIRWTTRPYSRVLKNKNKMLKSYQGAEGVKTGFTKRAGRCLVTSACRDDFRVICVVLNAPDMWNDTKKILDFAYQNYKILKIARGEIGYLRVKDSKENWIKLGITEQNIFVLTKDQYPGLNVVISKKVSAPVKKYTEVGKLEIKYDHQTYSVPIATLQGCQRKTFWDKLKERFFGQKASQK
ncbi:Serine-type D-Ala-D-Ala carboxypeptidase [Caldicellulosiruptor saccharolyticus DSM 8903]|uniref:serine-type D-Ala-D-Ala carboxypeptidase n=1 Tax=Caldicellulosiruptor saccharolyticus (strain ATCC 43494 / DSM 8903 / Tp8T 6331) TaxID=351627 RepID=A4XKJ5_CALS8|nr:D-alanyl-D-alanine carboxypeptidase family protein [Caldicellulosiruptor saccharolyticus]ABP67430.1 Serine-type D-Ala-D-Ala carboxypeptidase [Caldicellulosiruptor saccharolyticus DSM 8903]